MTQKNLAELSQAAQRLEQELARFEELASELRRPLNSEKSLQRARQSLEACSRCEAKLAEHLHAFADAMQTLQARQQRCMELVRTGAEHIQARHQERTTLLERVSSLGTRAREVSEPLSAISSEDAASGDSPDLLASIREVCTRLEIVIADADAVAEAAQQGDWTDIARDAQALKQQLQAVRSRVLLGQRQIAGRAPS
jgi:chromosome segregation ATPase